ncbi:hypothetical protein HY523_01155 [Candidatus Berkelbacteria bacterium]|nr:hypothetical protein [Candidatus Berkelbacteria bacterium]
MARLSISYDDNVVRIATTQQGRYCFGKALLPPGVVQDGLIIQGSRFGEAIHRALATNHFPVATDWQVILAPPEGRMITKLVELPRVPAAELDSFIRLQARTFLPIEPELLALDYQVVTSRTPNRSLILLIASPHEVIDALWQTLTNLGYRLEAVLPRSTALAQLTYDLPHTPKLLVDVEDDRTLTLIVTKNRTARFSTTVALGRNSQQIRSSIEQAIKYYNERDGQQRRVQEILVLPSRHARRLVRLLQSQADLPPVRLLEVPAPSAQGATHDVQSLVNLGLLKVSTKLNLLKSEYGATLQTWRLARVLRRVWIGQTLAALLLVILIGSRLELQLTTVRTLHDRSASQERPSFDAATFTAIVDAQALQRQLGQHRSATHAWFETIRTAQSPTIAIIRAQYLANDQTITLLGQRSTRASLVAFIRTLREEFSQVDVETADWAEPDGGLFHMTIRVR